MFFTSYVYSNESFFFAKIEPKIESPLSKITISIRVRMIYKKLDQTDAVILCDLDWLIQYLVQ